MTIDTSPSLSEVQEAFSAWRRERPTRQTPPALRAQAVALLQRYPITQVLQALRIDHRRLSGWRRALAAHAESDSSSSFIELPAVEPASPASAERVSISDEPAASIPIELTLSRRCSDGVTVSVSGALEAGQWRWAMALLSEAEA